MKRFVLGFMFNESLTRLVAIRKNRPAWQKWALNGVGGHIAVVEKPIEAMVRKFREETGVKTQPHEWRHVLTLRFTYAEVEVFAANCDDFYNRAKTKTDEEIVKVHIGSRTYYKMIENLPMLIDLSTQRLAARGGVAPKDWQAMPG